MRDDLVRAVLGCGIDDLSLLDDARADIFKIVKKIRDEGREVNLSSILEEVFKEGIFQMGEEVTEDKEWLEDLERSGIISEFGIEKLQAIRKHNLNPQQDFEYHINYLDTHLNIDSGKREVYEEYFEQQMKALSDYTGFSIEG